MAIQTESFLARFFRTVSYTLNPRTILLDRFQYVHLQDDDTGQITLHEGPTKIHLKANQVMLGEVRPKIILEEGEFAVILNPYNPQLGDLEAGGREVRIGPTMFALHAGEEIEDGQQGIRREYVLTDKQALLLRALKETPHPIQPDQILQAGEQVLLRGACRYLPHKDIEVVTQRETLPLSENEGIYVQDQNTGQVRLVRGPQDYFLQPREVLWEKYLSEEEAQALGYKQQSVEQQVRTLSAAMRPRKNNHQAAIVSLEDREAMYLYDGEQVRVLFGPQTIFLQPNERPKVLFLSGDVPIRANVLRVAKLSLGPDFMRDSISVRTKDNATLKLNVAYRWRFEVEPDHPEKLFVLKDFVGFAAQTLSAEIRGEAARHDFEKFHAEANSLINAAIFGQGQERVFTENGLIIFGIDVENVTPEGDEISAKLATAILTNVEIYTQTTREKAQLVQEGELLEQRATNEEQSQKLLDQQIINQRRKTLEEEQLNRETAVLRAEAAAEASRIKSQTDLANEQARREAELALEEKRRSQQNQLELEHLRALMELLETDGGKLYVQLEQVRALKATDKVIVPTDSRIALGTASDFLE